MKYLGKSLILIITQCLVSQFAYGQYLVVSNGVITSSFSNKNNLPILGSKVTSYFGQVGVEYGNSKWFSFASQLGYLNIGGQEENNGISQPDYQVIRERKKYLQVNTSFRPYLKFASTRVFVGAGPTVDFALGENSFKSKLYNDYFYNRVRLGSKFEAGASEDIKKFRFGVVGAYLVDITPTAKSEFLSLHNNAFTVLLTTGYRFR